MFILELPESVGKQYPGFSLLNEEIMNFNLLFQTANCKLKKPFLNKMKIGIVGNMNNSYFSLARYLRDEGFECELLIFKNEPEHFDPSFDTFSNNYKSYCKNLSWGDPANFLTQDFSIVKKDLEPYNFLIGNGPAPGYAARVGRKLDIFMPYGYDLYSLPFYRMVHPLRLLSYLKLSHFQKQGIKESRYVLFDRTNKEFEIFFEKLHLNGKRIISPAPMLYHKDYENGTAAIAHPVLDKVKKLRQENEVLIVQHTRQVWKKASDKWSYKGNDLLIKGYAKFLQQYPALKAKLILFEYGENVEDTKKLIEQLQLNDAIVWMPMMPRNKLMEVLHLGDLIIGELHHSWLSYGVALEALCAGKPLMHKRIDEEFNKDYSELYPMIYADSEETVFEGLKKTVNNKAEIQSIGDGGKEWFYKYCVEKPINEIGKIIQNKMNEKPGNA